MLCPMTQSMKVIRHPIYFGYYGRTRPKDQGGLGLRKARELNQAYLMKLGWAILNNLDKLWVQVLTCKYMKETDSGPQLRRKSGGSSLWRGIRA
ncbi:Putative ribonuclease H protein At1g65750, partial [Linum perenne]